MRPFPNEVNIQCNNCFGMIKTTIDELEEDNRLSCYHCFSTQSVDVEKLARGLSKLGEKVRHLKED